MEIRGQLEDKKVNPKSLTRIISEKSKTLERVGALVCLKKLAYCVQASTFVSSPRLPTGQKCCMQAKENSIEFP